MFRRTALDARQAPSPFSATTPPPNSPERPGSARHAPRATEGFEMADQRLPGQPRYSAKHPPRIGPSPWRKGMATAPDGGPFLVRSQHIPIGSAVAGGWSYAIAQRGSGQRAGIWALNLFWPFKPNRMEPSADLWEEWAPLP